MRTSGSVCRPSDPNGFTAGGTRPAPPRWRSVWRAARVGGGILGTALVLAVSVVAVWTLFERHRDPLGALRARAVRVDAVEETSYPEVTAAGERRLFRDVVLSGTDDVRFTVSLPANEPGPFPVVLIVGGLEIGRQSLAYVSRHGNNALIGYEYPYSPEYWYEGAPLTEIPAIRRAVLAVPAQLAAILAWTRRQPWCDPLRMTALGYSFGALFMPAAYRVAEAEGIRLQKGILAYGGVDCELLLRRNLGFEAAWQRALVAWLAATAIRPVEPALHVPHLQQEMLLINGRHDTLIPVESFARLHALKPEPKEILLLEAGHMHPRKRDLTARLVEMSRAWLLEREIIDP